MKRPEVGRAKPAEPKKPAKATANAKTGTESRSTTSAQPSTTAAAKKSAPKPERLTPAGRKKASATAQARREVREAVKARKAFERNEIRRFTAHLRRRRITIFTIIGSVLGLAIFVGIGVFSPLMALQKVQVVGTNRVDQMAIVADLQNQIGRPLPLVDTRAIEQSLAKQPLVKSYSTQSIPPHTLVVRIVERSPIGYLQTSQGFNLVDPAGVSIELTPTRVSSVPLIVVNGGAATASGFPAAVAVLRALPASLQGKVDQVTATTTDDVSFVLKDSGVRVVWGSPEQSDLKARVLASLMKAHPASGSSVYDVSSPASVVVR
jgi:cell division protein FtsQ